MTSNYLFERLPGMREIQLHFQHRPNLSLRQLCRHRLRLHHRRRQRLLRPSPRRR
jgi:hypothetical protein